MPTPDDSAITVTNQISGNVKNAVQARSVGSITISTTTTPSDDDATTADD
jgi:hypothetical protein